MYIHRITISYNWVIISIVMSTYQFALMLNTSLLCSYIVKFNADLRVPPAIKKRGRPKDSNLTVIGLPTKRQKSKRGKICSFLQLHTSEKVKGLVHENHISLFVVKLFLK